MHLQRPGIQLCSGAQGNTDEAVEAYLKGELVSAGTTCDHHHHEEGHSCGDHEEGHSCGGTCGGGCGSHKPAFTGPNVGKTCRTHYRGELLTMEHSSILLMTVASRWNSSAEQAR